MGGGLRSSKRLNFLTWMFGTTGLFICLIKRAIPEYRSSYCVLLRSYYTHTVLFDAKDTLQESHKRLAVLFNSSLSI